MSVARGPAMARTPARTLGSVHVSHGARLVFDIPGSKPKRSLQAAPVATEGVIREEEWRNRERANMLAALRQAKFRISGKGGAADLVGIQASTFTSRMKVLGIERGG